MFGVKKAAFVFLFIIISAFSLFAFDVPDRPSAYVNDFASVILDKDRAMLESVLHDYEKSTTNQLVVVTVPSLDGKEIEDFSIRLAEKWKIGQAGKDNGIIFIVAVDDRRARIEVGYGLEGVLTDAYASAILNDYVFPYFKKGQYSAGIVSGVSRIISLTSDMDVSPLGSDAESSAVVDSYGRPVSGEGGDVASLVRFVIIVLVALLLLDALRAFFRLFGRAGRRMDFFEWIIAYSWTVFVIKLLFRILLLMMFNGRTFGSGSSRGGFSGGGGGSFGGGGASGSW